MLEQNEKRERQGTKKLTTRKMVMIAIMGAVSTVLMLFEFPVPFAPVFIKMDFSELPILLCGFIYGPLAGVMTAFIKIVLNMLIGGTETMGIGDLANFIVSVAYVLPAVYVYKMNHTKKGAIIGLVLGTLTTTCIAVFNNMYIMFPVYAKLFHMPLEAIVDMANAVNPFVHDLFTLMLFTMVPFNLLKFGLVSVITFFVYKKISVVIRKFAE